MTSPTELTCSTCARVLPIAEFDAAPRNRTGRVGYCKSCRRARQAKRRQDLTETFEERTPPSEQRCCGCGATKPAGEFGICRGMPNGLQAHCRLCQRESRMLREFGLSHEKFNDLVARQGGACAICDEQLVSPSWAIDHNHACCPNKITCGRCVRGVLCGRCNKGLGLFRERAELLELAAAYLRGGDVR